MVEVIECVKSSQIADFDMVTLSTWVDFKTESGSSAKELSEEAAKKLVQKSQDIHPNKTFWRKREKGSAYKKVRIEIKTN